MIDIVPLGKCGADSSVCTCRVPAVNLAEEQSTRVPDLHESCELHLVCVDNSIKFTDSSADYLATQKPDSLRSGRRLGHDD